MDFEQFFKCLPTVASTSLLHGPLQRNTVLSGIRHDVISPLGQVILSSGTTFQGTGVHGGSFGDCASLDLTTLNHASLDCTSLDGTSLDGTSLDSTSLDSTSLD